MQELLKKDAILNNLSRHNTLFFQIIWQVLRNQWHSVSAGLLAPAFYVHSSKLMSAEIPGHRALPSANSVLFNKYLQRFYIKQRNKYLHFP
jgi:hypothetical protein